MTVILRNRLIGWGFELGALWARKRLRWASPGRLRLGSLDHITIPVKDLALAREFYCDVLGASYFMTVDDETFRRFGRPPAPNHGQGAYHISVYAGGAVRLSVRLLADVRERAAGVRHDLSTDAHSAGFIPSVLAASAEMWAPSLIRGCAWSAFPAFVSSMHRSMPPLERVEAIVIQYRQHRRRSQRGRARPTR